jgi:hypothetical protein
VQVIGETVGLAIANIAINPPNRQVHQTQSRVVGFDSCP